MKSKTSFFNKGLLYSNLKRYGWVSALWAVLIFLAVPLPMMSYQVEDSLAYLQSQTDNMQLFLRDFGGILSNLMLCGFPVLIGVLMFRYLHSPKSATVLHGLPFSRPRLFANGVLSGLVLMLFPFLLNVAIVLLVKAAMPIGAYIEYATVFTWLLNSVCMALAVFGLTVFVGMFTGNLMAHFVFTYIVHFLPLALWVLFNELFSQLVYGYQFISPPDWLTKFPMTFFTQNFVDCDAAYAIAGVVLLALAMVVYRKRPLENASDIVVFKVIRPIFKYGVTFCAAITGYIYFYSMGFGQSIIIAFVFAIIGYALAQMLLSKTWRIWKSYKGMLVSLAVILVFWGGVKMDLTGYEKRVPQIPEVKSVIVYGFTGIQTYAVELTQEADIAKVVDLHEKLSQNQSYKEEQGKPYRERMYTPGRSESFRVEYTLKNGSSMSRSYTYRMEDYEQEMLALYASEEVRRRGFPVIYKSAADVEAISVCAFYDDKNAQEYRITEKAKIEELMSTFKVDVEHISSEDLLNLNGKASTVSLSFEMRPDDSAYKNAQSSGYEVQMYTTAYSYQLTEAFTSTNLWIEKNVLEQQAQ